MSTSQNPEAVEPDQKDWTFVITQGCAECGFVPPDAHGTGAQLRATIAPWQQVLARPDVATRPEPTVWSPLEYGAHVRDVCQVFSTRLALMLDADEPTFPNWDQDQAALDGRYWECDPAEVSRDYGRLATQLADEYDAVGGGQWERKGLRSNGSAFTVATLGTYLMHDIHHHLHDVDADRA